MKTHLRLGAVGAAFALSLSAVQALDVLYVANAAADSGVGATTTAYKTFIEAQFPGSNWVSKTSGATVGTDTVGGDLDLTTKVLTGLATPGITQKAYLQSFDLVIIGVGVNSGNFQEPADWATITKPVLIHPSLAARGIRMGMFTGDNNLAFPLADLVDTTRVSVSPLSDAIFEGVTDPANLYDFTVRASIDTINAIATFGGGELISSVTDGIASHRGIVFWGAGTANGNSLTLAAKRAFLPLANVANGFATLTVDGQAVLKNLIDELLVTSAPVFLPPSGIVAKSGIASINLSWTSSTDATSYNIKRSETAGGPYTTVSTAGAVTGTSYTDPGLVNGTTYYYVITAVDDSPVAESAISAEVSAVPVAVIQPAKSILYVSNSDSPVFQNFATNGQFANNTWTQKPTGTGTADNQIGGDLDRTTNFTGTSGGTGITVRAYLESFDLIIIGVPTTSLNFVDGADGANWASITKPILFNAAVVARSQGGRPGLFAGDNFITFTHGAPADSARESTSALSDAILAGVGDVTNLYTLTQSDTISGVVPVPNAYGNGEQITSLTDGTIKHRGVVFWPAGATLPILPPNGLVIASNRAYFPLKGNLSDLTADGQKIMGNLINQLFVIQTVPPALLTIPTELTATDAGGKVDLVWADSIGVATYTVKRSTTAGSGYVPIGTGVSTTSFTDTTVTAGTTYYYVVSAVSAAPAESANSVEATVTLAGGGFGVWIDDPAFNTPPLTAEQKLPDADPDFDGTANILEFALNGSPVDPSDNGAIASLIQDTGGAPTKELTLIVAVRDGATFTAGTATIDGITYTVEGSLNLTFPGPVVSSTAPSDTAPAAANLPDLTGKAWEYHTFKLDASEGLPGKGFLRLKVTQP